jgi:putative sensor protein/histidine kinase/DNA gyrase B/HSP90-like ATPase
MAATQAARTVVRAALAAPVSRRALRELLFTLTGLAFILPFPIVVFFGTLLLFHIGAPGSANPALWHMAIALLAAAGAVAAFVGSGAARWLGGTCRGFVTSLLGERVPPPAPFMLGSAAAGPGWGARRARVAARLRDRPSWRAFSYAMLKFPVAVLSWYAVSFWAAGLIDLSYPFWWLSFRNHAPGVTLSPVPVFTPFGWFGQGAFSVNSFGGTFAAFAAGAGMLLAAPWVTRAVVSVDRWLVPGLLGPGTLRQRLRDLELTRAIAVDDSAALLRQVERNLHDGAQIRLATLAMNLGMAREKLAAAEEAAGAPGGGVTGGRTADAGVGLAAVRELVDAAHQGAKDALSELRELAKGIHPPVLDNGLADALATLAAGSAIPAIVTAKVPRRPKPAIETIAYFCTAELLANAVKHSSASHVEISVTEHAGSLLLDVTDDGTGGADPAAGGGLAGLAQRVRTVDGRLTISSPPGGPTRVSVELPLRV